MGMLRMRPEERLEYQKRVQELWTQHFGIPLEIQEDARKFGIKLTDWLPLSPEDRDLFRQLEGDDQWRGLSTHLRESEVGQAFAHTRAFNDEVRAFREGTVVDKQALEQRLLLPEGNENHITLDTWETLVKEENAKAFLFRDNLAKSYKYSEALTTFEKRMEFAREHDEAPMIQHPTDELIMMYFEIKPETGFNPDTGNTEVLWEKFFTDRRIFKESLPARLRGEVLDVLNRWDTSMESAREQDFQIMQPYFDARDLVLGTLSDEERQVVAKWQTTDDPDTRVSLREAQDDDGNSIVSKYQTTLGDFRASLRELQPEVDGRLVLWNRLAPRTEAATEVARQLRQQYGLR